MPLVSSRPSRSQPLPAGDWGSGPGRRCGAADGAHPPGPANGSSCEPSSSRRTTLGGAGSIRAPYPCQALPHRASFFITRVRRGGYVFVTWIGDHPRATLARRLRTCRLLRQRCRAAASLVIHEETCALAAARHLDRGPPPRAQVTEKSAASSSSGTLSAPGHSRRYEKADPRPGRDDPIVELFIDPELAHEGFSYVLASGTDGGVLSTGVFDCTGRRRGRRRHSSLAQPGATHVHGHKDTLATRRPRPRQPRAVPAACCSTGSFMTTTRSPGTCATFSSTT